MVSNDNNKNFEVINSKCIRINSFDEIHIDRTKSSEKDLIKIGRWKLVENTGEWRSCGGFSMNTDSFPKFLRELILFYLSVKRQQKVRFQ